MNQALFLFMFVWLFGALYWLLFRYKKSVSERYFGSAWTPKGLYRPNTLSFVVRVVCLVASWALVCIALIAPLEQYKRVNPLEIQAQDVDEVVFVLDVSRSMQAKDTSTKESRLDRAKEIISQIVQSLSGVNVSLVSFDGGVKLVVPPTEDYLYFRILLDAVSQDVSDASGQEFVSVIDFLEKRTQRAAFEKSQVFVLLSDADKTAAPPAVRILNAKWEVIGFGTTGRSDGFLQTFTQKAHGRFFDEQKEPLLSIVQAIEGDISVKSDRGESASVEPMNEKTFFVLFTAFFFILLALLLPQGIRQ